MFKNLSLKRRSEKSARKRRIASLSMVATMSILKEMKPIKFGKTCVKALLLASLAYE
jgi:hypothetical protein